MGGKVRESRNKVVKDLHATRVGEQTVLSGSVVLQARRIPYRSTLRPTGCKVQTAITNIRPFDFLGNNKS